MLPSALTTDICSLVGGQERLAFSAFWIVDKSTMLPDENVKPRFTKSVIKSAAAMTYEQAQTMIDDPTKTDELALSLRRLRDIARKLRKRRMDNGALTLASPEVRFEMDQQSSDLLDVGMYVTRETNQMVEEMMLLANISTAERILEAYPAAMLRRHPIPEQKMFEPLLKAAKACGVEIDSQSTAPWPRVSTPPFVRKTRISTRYCACRRRGACLKPCIVALGNTPVPNACTTVWRCPCTRILPHLFVDTPMSSCIDF